MPRVNPNPLTQVTPAELKLWNKLRYLIEGFYAQGKSGQWRLAQVEAARNGDLVMLRWCRNMPLCMHDAQALKAAVRYGRLYAVMDLTDSGTDVTKHTIQLAAYAARDCTDHLHADAPVNYLRVLTYLWNITIPHLQFEDVRVRWFNRSDPELCNWEIVLNIWMQMKGVQGWPPLAIAKANKIKATKPGRRFPSL